MFVSGKCTPRSAAQRPRAAGFVKGTVLLESQLLCILRTDRHDLPITLSLYTPSSNKRNVKVSKEKCSVVTTVNQKISSDLIQQLLFAHVKCVLCHHDLARPQITGGGNGLEVGRGEVAANMFNKQSWKVDKGWSSGLDLGVANTACRKIQCYTESRTAFSV